VHGEKGTDANRFVPARNQFVPRNWFAVKFAGLKTETLQVDPGKDDDAFGGAASLISSPGVETTNKKPSRTKSSSMTGDFIMMFDQDNDASVHFPFRMHPQFADI
jgi:hypothetical protein